jgi:putative hydrolase of the HAD superfamily
MLQALILDFGEVLVRPQSAAIVAEMAGLAGLERDEFQRRYWQHRRVYDDGAPAGEYWKLVLGSDVPAGVLDNTIAALKDADARSWTDYREEIWTLAAGVRASGGKTAFLSNGVREVMALVRAQRRLADYFDVVIVSYEVGFTKPDGRIYELCLTQLGVPASSALFVDDRAENIQAAARLGIRTLLFLGDESVRALRETVACREV